MSLGNLAKEIHCIAIEKGWYDNPKSENEFIESACNNLHDEVSELHEAWRNNKLFELCDKAEKMKEIGISPLTCIEEEFADIIIRVLDDCQHLNIDIEKAVYSKIEYNKTRPYRHGGKRS